MPNLVGIGNSQVPTNAMLGGLAYQDSSNATFENFEPGNISKITGTIDEYAGVYSGNHRIVDLLVYDTTKDSDGGAWRRRTRDCSWFNESPSVVRGERKQFPAIAIIVLHKASGSTEGVENDIVIYDADDPSMPMWMKVRFKLGGGYNKYNTLCAKNGWIAWGATDNGICIMDFPKDRIRIHNHVHRHTYQNIYPSRLGRTAAASRRSEVSVTGYTLKGQLVKCMDMTVLPDAPVDPDTGLPRPTIAGSSQSDSGWWIIFDDYSTSHIGESTGQGGYGRYGDNVRFVLGGNWLFAGKNTYGSSDRHSNMYRVRYAGKDNDTGVFATATYATIDFVDNGSDANRNNQFNWTGNFAAAGGGSDGGRPRAVGVDDDIFVVGKGSNCSGVNRLYIKKQGRGDTDKHIRGSMLCTTGYAGYAGYVTGWSPGEIRCQYLMDTLSDALSGTGDLSDTYGTVENWHMKTSADGWRGDSGASVTHTSQNTLTVTNGGGDNTFALAKDSCLISGHKYRITGRIVPTFSGSYTFRVRAGGSGVQWSITSGLTSGQAYDFNTGTITADGSTLEIGSHGGGITQFTITNLVVYSRTVEDRSQFARNLTATGGVKRRPVADGAELCGFAGGGTSYGRYDSNNYLYYNGMATPGTGDFCVAFWAKSPPSSGYGAGGNYFHAFSLGSSSTGGQSNTNGFVIKAGAQSDGMRWYPWSGNGQQDQGIDWTKCVQPYNTWGLIICGRRNGIWEMWVNGQLMDTGDSDSSNMSANYLTIGLGLSQTSETVDATALALMRFATGTSCFPDEEMIGKMYADEKMLFQDNAKCTIYGTSDSMTGLAYDQDTGLLHVGTSAGRSDFNNLCRINNTTTPVTRAISASNGIIAER